MRDFIIVANGDFLIREIIAEAVLGKTIVALDGAVQKLRKLRIQPHVIAGDFDSINQEEMDFWGIQQGFDELTDDAKPYQGRHQVLIVPTKDQKEHDLAKAIHYCDSQGAKSITLICACGGYLDLHEGTLRALYTAYKKDRPIVLHTERETVRFARDETVVIAGQINDRCGIIAFPKGAFSSQGLRYDVNNMPLTFGVSESISNALAQEQATVKVTGDALIIMPPQLQAQRDMK
jgi:thiamine pyrophosphokinase